MTIYTFFHSSLKQLQTLCYARTSRVPNLEQGVRNQGIQPYKLVYRGIEQISDYYTPDKKLADILIGSMSCVVKRVVAKTVFVLWLKKKNNYKIIVVYCLLFKVFQTQCKKCFMTRKKSSQNSTNGLVTEWKLGRLLYLTQNQIYLKKLCFYFILSWGGDGNP